MLDVVKDNPVIVVVYLRSCVMRLAFISGTRDGAGMSGAFIVMVMVVEKVDVVFGQWGLVQ